MHLPSIPEDVPISGKSSVQTVAAHCGYDLTQHHNAMADAYACANILISRAGSNTLCEILALRKPALLIPYPMGASRGDQILNAQSFDKRGYAKLLLEEDLTNESLLAAVNEVYENHDHYIKQWNFPRIRRHHDDL